MSNNLTIVNNPFNLQYKKLIFDNTITNKSIKEISEKYNLDSVFEIVQN